MQVMVVSAPSPVNMEPPAPPVTQRRISARDAKLVEGAELHPKLCMSVYVRSINRCAMVCIFIVTFW